MVIVGKTEQYDVVVYVSIFDSMHLVNDLRRFSFENGIGILCYGDSFSPFSYDFIVDKRMERVEYNLMHIIEDSQRRGYTTIQQSHV